MDIITANQLNGGFHIFITNSFCLLTEKLDQMKLQRTINRLIFNLINYLINSKPTLMSGFYYCFLKASGTNNMCQISAIFIEFLANFGLGVPFCPLPLRISRGTFFEHLLLICQISDNRIEFRANFDFSVQFFISHLYMSDRFR